MLTFRSSGSHIFSTKSHTSLLLFDTLAFFLLLPIKLPNASLIEILSGTPHSNLSFHNLTD